MTKVHDIFESMLDFGASYEDEKPTKISDLLNTGVTDWRQVKPYTPVFVRDTEDEDWTRALFLKYVENERKKFKVAYYSKWTYSGDSCSWRYCRLATQEEIDAVKTDRH